MFKIIVVCALVAAASAVSRFGGSNFGRYVFRGAASNYGFINDDAHAEVINHASDVRPDGFDYVYDITNGIHGAASGNANGDIKGDFSWVAPEGEHIAVQYVADENGYQPKSASLPTPPPVPEAIVRSLKYIRTHPTYEESGQGFAQQSAKSFVQKPFKRIYNNNFRRYL